MSKKRKLTAANVISVRPNTHGDFTDGANFTQSVMRLATPMIGYAKMTDVQKEGFHMIIHKLQRVLAGDPNFHDHWVDIAGYAQLVADRCSR